MEKVLFHLHCLGKGGAERVVVNLAEKFIDNGYQVVIAVVEETENEYQLVKQIKRCYAGPSKREERINGRVKKFCCKINRLHQILIEEEPDVIIAFGKSSNYRAMMAKWGTNIPVLVSVRNDPKADYSGKANWILRKLFLERAQGCVFQTEEAKSFFSTKLQNKSRVILNPIHEKYLTVQRQGKAREKRIVAVGRLAKQKNHMLLLQAFRQICEEFPDYVLQIYGGKTKEATADELERYIKEKKIEHKVEFKGIADDLERQLPEAALFVLPSDYEGMPNVLMEAMVMGLPVIATDCPCGGPGTLIEEGENGLLVPVGDVEAMADAIKLILRDTKKAEALGKKAADIRDIANADIVFKQWESFIREIIERNKSLKKTV